MRSKQLNAKNLAIATVSCVVLYIIFTSGYHKYQIDTVIANTRPEDAWEYVADFSKMHTLNPTILDFKIISDGGNRIRWDYTVVYNEKLSHWPYWKNTATADYTVIRPMPDAENQTYIVESKHDTCFFGGIYCLHAESEFKFSAIGKDAYCAEKIQYQCPPFLSLACRRELEHQRKTVMDNLKIIFGKKQKASLHSQ